MNRNDRKQKLLLAKPDVDSAIKRHGLDSVRYVLARRLEAYKIKRRLTMEKSRLLQRMKEIEAKLNK